MPEVGICSIDPRYDNECFFWVNFGDALTEGKQWEASDRKLRTEHAKIPAEDVPQVSATIGPHTMA